MPTAIREAALAAIAVQLTAQLAGVVVERARRAPVDTDAEILPRVVLRGEEWEADETQEPGRTYYRIGFSVAGYITAATDLAAEQALSALHASVIAALAGWTPTTAGLGDVSEQSGEFRLYDADESARPAGEFVARFTILAVATTGNPYIA